MVARTVIPIDQNWQFKQADRQGDEFRAVAQFPTNVHLDLMHHGLIPDPFIGKNENDVQWVGEAQWTYKTTFATPKVDSGARAVLAFEGLDTFATVTLNGAVILETDSMFIPERVDVTSRLSQDSDNELVITFDSAYLRGWKRVEEHPNHVWSCWNGDNSRLAVRKAQYHWVGHIPKGFGALLLTAALGLGLGPCSAHLRPLETHQSRDIRVQTYRPVHYQRN